MCSYRYYISPFLWINRAALYKRPQLIEAHLHNRQKKTFSILKNTGRKPLNANTLTTSMLNIIYRVNCHCMYVEKCPICTGGHINKLTYFMMEVVKSHNSEQHRQLLTFSVKKSNVFTVLNSVVQCNM